MIEAKCYCKSDMRAEYKHIYFAKLPRPAKRKTDIWECFNWDVEHLGEVRWDAHWRQYVWWQSIDIDIKMARSCLLDVADFIKQLMDARKKM